jgi:GNAT superfamily N-acetyltransferase
MNITVESTIADEHIAAFYEVYAAAFGPMRTRAAARHMLTADEFAAEMTDERIDKYVVWDVSGQPAAIATLATDLSAIPWISPEYFAAQYPDQLADGRVYYLGYTLVKPQYAGKGIHHMLMEQVKRRLATDRAVCGYDVCAFNDAGAIGRVVGDLASAWGARIDRLDVQTYYAACFDQAETA